MENLINMPIPPAISGIVLIAVLAFCLYMANNKTRAKIEKPQLQAQAQIQETQEQPNKKNDEIPKETIAVIAAAVAAVLNTRSSYKITTIKRIEKNPNWKMINRYEQLN